MPMKDPPHPGLSVLHDCIEPLGLNVGEAAKLLAVPKKQLDDLINCKIGISPEMAIRLDKAFGGTAETWFAIQNHYDISQALKHADKIKIKKVKPIKRAVTASLRP